MRALPGHSTDLFPGTIYKRWARPPKHMKPVFAALAAIIVLLGGCHSTPSTPSTPSTIPSAPVTDSCALLTPNEVSDVVGVPIDPGKHVLRSSAIMCSWSQTGTNGESATKLIANFTSLDSFTKEKTPTNPRVTATPATGIGDDAFYVTTEFGISLYTRKGATAFVFGIRDKTHPPDQIKTQEKTLALKAAARL